MRTLILMRHAKSDWGVPGIPDESRPLNERGQRDTPRMARWLADQDLIPQLTLASTASRVRETVALLCEAWSEPPPVCYSEDLYLAAPEDILRQVRSDAVDCDRVMVVAHNPGLADLVQMLSGRPLSMPTAAIAVVHFKIDDWRTLSTRSPVESVDYRRPKSLGD